MSIENQTGNTAGADYRPAPTTTRTEPLTSSYVETERKNSSTSTDSTSGGNNTNDNSLDSAKKTANGDTLSASQYVQALLGDSTTPWGDKRDGTYPDQLDFAAGDLPDDAFSGRFNTLPGDRDKAKGSSDSKTTAAQSDSATATDDPNAPKKDAPNVVTNAITDAAKQVAAVPGEVAKAMDPTDLISSVGDFFMGGKVDKEAARIAGNAEKGKKHLDSQDKQYVKQWRSAPEVGNIAPPAEGDHPNKYTHKNADGSSYDVTDGRISGFTTAPTKENGNKGVTYSDIHYDKNNQIDSYVTPFGQKHTRTSTPDASGFANWKSTDVNTGKPANYGDSSTWKGKPVVNEEGFHNLIGNGTYVGQMFSRHMDGTQVTTKPEYHNNRMTGLDSTATLPDGTKVARHGQFNGNKLEQDNSNVRVREADGPKRSQVKFEAGSEKGEVVEPPKPADKSTAGGDMIRTFYDVLNGGTDMLNGMNSIDVTRTGPGQFHVAGDMNHVFMPPPNVTVGGFGPLGRVSATPQGGFVDKFDLNMKLSGDQLNVSDVHGVHGSAALTRQRVFGGTVGIGSRATSTTGAVWDMKNNMLLAKSDSSSVWLDKNNFAADSFTGKLLSDEKAEAKAKKTLETIDKSLNSFHAHKTTEGFDASIDTQQKRFAVDSGVKNVKANLYADDKIDLSKVKDGINFKKGEVQLGVQIGNNLETRQDVSRISAGVNSKGEPVLKVAFYGTDAQREIPVPKQETPAQQPPRDAAPAQPRPTTDQQRRTSDQHQQPTEHCVEQPKPVVRQPQQQQWQHPSHNEGSHRRRFFRR